MIEERFPMHAGCFTVAPMCHVSDDQRGEELSWIVEKFGQQTTKFFLWLRNVN